MQNVRFTWVVWTALALGLLAGACGGDGPGDGADRATDQNGVSSGGVPSGELLGYTSGRATIELTGDVEGTRGLSQGSGYVDETTATMSWLDEAGSSLSISGSAFTGTTETGPTLTLTVRFIEGDFAASFPSTTGTCSVTIDRAGRDGLEGSFTCSALLGGGAAGAAGPVDAEGMFELDP